MLWAANLADGKVGYAVWDLFSPEDLPKLREFLRKVVGFVGLGDPVHSQTIYLTPALLQRLFDMFGVRPIRIYQYPNEAVFIPAGYAHQVRRKISRVYLTDRTNWTILGEQRSSLYKSCM
jgi:hypothetical protein